MTATVTLVPVLLTYLPIPVLPTDIRTTRLENLAMTAVFRLNRRLFTSRIPATLSLTVLPSRAAEPLDKMMEVLLVQGSAPKLQLARSLPT